MGYMSNMPDMRQPDDTSETAIAMDPGPPISKAARRRCAIRVVRWHMQS